MSQKYKALRVISLFYRLLAVLVLIGGVVTLIASIAIKGSDVIVGILGLMGSLIGAVILFGLGEVFQLFIDIEENTRVTASAIKQLLKKGG